MYLLSLEKRVNCRNKMRASSLFLFRQVATKWAVRIKCDDAVFKI